MTAWDSGRVGALSEPTHQSDQEADPGALAAPLHHSANKML